MTDNNLSEKYSEKFQKENAHSPQNKNKFE